MINECVMTILYGDYDRYLFLIEDKDVKITNTKIRVHNLMENEAIQ